MSQDYSIVCVTCKMEGPIFASASGFYGYKVWDIKEVREWLGHKQDIGNHEHHDLRIVHESADLPWEMSDRLTQALALLGECENELENYICLSDQEVERLQALLEKIETFKKESAE